VDAETRLVMATARPVPGNTADAKAWRDSGLAQHCEGVTVLGDGPYINTGLVVPHRKRPGRPLLKGKEEDNAQHRKVRARVEHTFSRMKNYRMKNYKIQNRTKRSIGGNPLVRTRVTGHPLGREMARGNGGAMSETDNTRLMQRIFAGLAEGDGQPLAESLADDFRWTIIGTTKWSGTYEGKQTVLNELFRPLLAEFADTYTNTPQRIIAAGDCVVVECRGRATTTDGKLYHNTYCWVCQIEDGKLQALTEYCDTDLIARTLGTPGDLR
jgi:ketosteroid isomerase-like protein